MQASLQLSDFSGHVGAAFTLPFDDGTSLILNLSLAEALPVSNFPGRQREPFQLRFNGPGNALLPQQTYVVQHPSLGLIQLFLVPIGREGEAYIYQSVFN